MQNANETRLCLGRFFFLLLTLSVLISTPVQGGIITALNRLVRLWNFEKTNTQARDVRLGCFLSFSSRSRVFA